MKMDYKSKIISVKREKASEKSQKEVTIVLNVYNAGKTIDSFLDSLEVQTFKDFLLLVIDDGSTDQTVEKIKRYKDKFDMVVCRCPHQGLRRARKFGISKAKGNIILILDADLILDKNAVKEIIEPLKNTPKKPPKPVTIGISALRKACLKTTMFSSSPFALAVRT